MKYEDTLQEKEFYISYTTLISIGIAILFPWFLGMFQIFDFFFKGIHN
jgi:hypothetical protein